MNAVVDLHNHFVWGLDDGPASRDDSLAMLHMAEAMGMSDVVATPHCSAQYPFDAGLLASRIEELRSVTDGHPAIHRGCEFQATSDTLGPLLDHPATYTIGGGAYLLLEFPILHIGRHTEQVLSRILDAGVVPIVAHPERHPILRRDLARMEAWVEAGCITQITGLSITGGFGSQARAAALRMLDRGLVHVVASDAHDLTHRTPSLGAAFDAVRTRFEDGIADLLFSENPRGIVAGGSVAGGKLQVSPVRKRRWWQR